MPRLAAWAVAVATGWLLAAPPAGAQDAAWPLYRNEKLGFELRHPAAFVVGAYRDRLPPDLRAQLRAQGGAVPFEHAVVLVERTRVGSRDLVALPVGEVTAIAIERHAGAAASARRSLGRQMYGAAVVEVTLGPHRALRFPGFPGPYGDRAFYYLVPLAEDAVLELTAHRQFLEPPPGETGYDRVLERIIATLRLFPPRP